MKDFKTYFIDDDSCLRIKFNSSATDDLKVMRYARQKANCPFFRVMNAKKPYKVFRLELFDSKEQLYKLVNVGVIE